MISSVLAVMLLAVTMFAPIGCQKRNDVKVENHEEVNVEETVSQRMVPE